jgi:ion channel
VRSAGSPWRRLSRHPSAILLLVQLAGLLLYPLFEDAPARNAELGALGAVVLVLAVRMVHRASGHAWIAAALALPAIVLGALAALRDMPVLQPWAEAFEATFYFHAAGVLISYMLADRRATSDELFAAGATFTLLAWAFAHLFVLCQAVQPGAFSAAGDPASGRSWTELLFLSFTLLSSTGMGNVIPVTPHARALASVEMFVGVMYLTLVVSRLVGLTVLERKT